MNEPDKWHIKRDSDPRHKFFIMGAESDGFASAGARAILILNTLAGFYRGASPFEPPVADRPRKLWPKDLKAFLATALDIAGCQTLQLPDFEPQDQEVRDLMHKSLCIMHSVCVSAQPSSRLQFLEHNRHQNLGVWRTKSGLLVACSELQPRAFLPYKNYEAVCGMFTTTACMPAGSVYTRSICLWQ